MADDDLRPLAVVYRKASELVPDKRNARKHPEAQLDRMEASMLEYGFTNPVLVGTSNRIMAGHARLLTAERLWGKGKKIPRLKNGEVPTIDLSDLTPSQQRAYVLADNRLAEMAEWDDDLLRGELIDLRAEGFNLEATGFTVDDLDDLMQQANDASGRSQTVLSAVEVTIKEPKHEAKADDIWRVGKHRLFICDVILGHAAWSKHLKDGVAFCPFPGPFVPHGKKSSEYVLLMVQPDTYVAGHLLDRYAEVHGDKAVWLEERGGLRHPEPE